MREGRACRGRQIAIALKGFDLLLLQFRSTCTDFAETKKALDDVMGTVFAFHNITLALSSLAKVNCKAPKRAICNNKQHRVAIIDPCSG